MKSREKFEKYLKDQTKDLESDELTKEIITNYFQEEKLRERWKKILNEQHNYGQPENSVPVASKVVDNKRNIKRLFAVALIGMAASMFWFFNSTTGSTIGPVSPVDQLLSEHYAKPFARDVLKGPESTLAIRGKAYQFYQNKNYHETISLLEELVAVGGEEQKDYFYLGLSYLYSDQPEEAAKRFKTLLEGPTNNYQDIATWYLGLALTDAGEYEEAKIHLSKVATWTGNKGKENTAKDAIELLRVIEEKNQK